MFFSHGAQPEGGVFPAISVSDKQASNATSNIYWPSPSVRRAAGKKTGEPPPGREEEAAGKKVPRINITAPDSRLAVPGQGEAAGGSCGGRVLTLIARIFVWVFPWASVVHVARPEASPPIVLRGNPLAVLAVRTSWSVSAVLMVTIMAGHVAGGVASVSAKRCDTVIPDLPLNTTKIYLSTCNEGTIPAQIGKLTSLQDLQLQWTSLSGTIPPDIGNLVKLTLLSFALTKIEGTIPPDIGKLVKLTELSFYSAYKLTGECERLCDHMSRRVIGESVAFPPDLFFHL